MIVNEEGRFLDDIGGKPEPAEERARHAGPDVVVVVEGRMEAVAALRPGLSDVVEEGGEADGELLRGAGPEGEEVVFPHGVDVVEVLADADALLELGDDDLEESGLLEEVDAVRRVIGKDDAREFVADAFPRDVRDRRRMFPYRFQCFLFDGPSLSVVVGCRLPARIDMRSVSGRSVVGQL